jgi:hypothetical protein
LASTWVAAGCISCQLIRMVRARRRATRTYLRQVELGFLASILTWIPWIGPFAFAALSVFMVRTFTRRGAATGRPKTARAAVILWLVSGVTFQAGVLMALLKVRGLSPYDPFDLGVVALLFGAIWIGGMWGSVLCTSALANGWIWNWKTAEGPPPL